ncbi:MAG TPA: DUF4124 domain-containing protein [Casimicrobiaceae bacterium]|nr:DUF4124 domain-containing protein [Casimicrobiaceae bacterium]
MRPRTASALPILLTAMAAVALPATAQVFKCVDGSGRVTYQQTACSPAQNGKQLDLVLDNGSGKDAPEVEARWKGAADQHDVLVGMPKRWVQQSLGAPTEVRPGSAGEGASEIWTYQRPTATMRVGFVANVVVWNKSQPAAAETNAIASTEGVDAARGRVAADRMCDEVIAELGPPSSQEPARVNVGTAGTLRTVDGMRFAYEPVPGGLPARLAFVCVDGRVASVSRDVVIR